MAQRGGAISSRRSMSRVGTARLLALSAVVVLFLSLYQQAAMQHVPFMLSPWKLEMALSFLELRALPGLGFLVLVRLAKHYTQAQTTETSVADREARERWCMLLAVCLCTATNAFVCMTFSVMKVLTGEAFEKDDQEVASLYTIWLGAVAAGLTVGTLMTDRFEGVAVIVSAVFNMASVIVRVFGVQQRNYTLLIVSQLLCAVGAWPIFTLPGEVSHRYFPVRDRPFATSIMWQANYFGWLLGLFWPWMFTTTEGLDTLFSIEAALSIVWCLAALVLFTVAKLQCLSPVFRTKEISGFSGHAGLSGFKELFQTMARQPRFALELISHGLHGGVAFATPSAVFFIFGHHNFSTRAGAAANGVFILAGNVCGIWLGERCKSPSSWHPVLKLCYGVSLLSLVTLGVLMGGGHLNGDSYLSLATVLTFCTACGASSLGFVGIGVESSSLYKVSEAYVGWFREFIVLGSAAYLAYVAVGGNGFSVLATAMGLCTVSVLISLSTGLATRSRETGTPIYAPLVIGSLP
eukprot:TRINITY_DN43898_c0_g1_i1.p1 TRINITY_DN43898_c0_g1~~TRINITY_DN43898_c0_g1_i1.p1  ORF type:complete len:521 (-),score=69.94 TRINITY_DN43898_c0_g1_i1:90-1652(-)